MTIAETIAAQAAELEKQRDAATARIDTLAQEHATAIAAKDAELATIRAALEEKQAYQAMMEERVATVLQSGDPAQYEALAQEFLTPAQELARKAKLAELAEIEAKAAALKAELGV